jgi:carbon storage regulator
MLVLTRRIGEELMIAGNIRVMVVAVKGNQVRLGIAAPASVPVARLELLAECSWQMEAQPSRSLRRSGVRHFLPREQSRARS